MTTDTKPEVRETVIRFRVNSKERKYFEKLRKETGLSYSEMLRKSAEIISAAVNKKPLNISDLLSSSQEAAELITKTITKAKK